jgi:hypothetical protein
MGTGVAFARCKNQAAEAAEIRAAAKLPWIALVTVHLTVGDRLRVAKAHRIANPAKTMAINRKT